MYPHNGQSKNESKGTVPSIVAQARRKQIKCKLNIRNHKASFKTSLVEGGDEDGSAGTGAG